MLLLHMLHGKYLSIYFFAASNLAKNIIYIIYTPSSNNYYLSINKFLFLPIKFNYNNKTIKNIKICKYVQTPTSLSIFANPFKLFP